MKIWNFNTSWTDLVIRGHGRTPRGGGAYPGEGGGPGGVQKGEGKFTFSKKNPKRVKIHIFEGNFSLFDFFLSKIMNLGGGGGSPGGG